MPLHRKSSAYNWIDIKTYGGHALTSDDASELPGDLLIDVFEALCRLLSAAEVSEGVPPVWLVTSYTTVREELASCVLSGDQPMDAAS